MEQQNQKQPQKGQVSGKKTEHRNGRDNGRQQVQPRVDKKAKYHELVEQGGLVFKLDIAQTVIATQMFKSNDYMMSKLSKNTGLGTKSSSISGDALRILDYKRYSVLLQLHELNKELAVLSETTYNPPSNFHESLKLEEVNEFLSNNKIETDKKPKTNQPAKTVKLAPAPVQSAAA